MKSKTRNLMMLAGIGLALLLPVRVESAENNALRNLSAEWWQWVSSIPVAENPALDPTGAKCAVGQRGSTWFLAGTFGGTVTRTCSVPTGKEIFFPVANISFFDSPNQCGQGPDHFSVAEMRSALAGAIAGLSDLSAEIDGKPVKNLQRVRSRVFEVALPPGNPYDSAAAPCPAGIYSPALADGYYVLLEPLTAGQHTLHFHAEAP
jgi:hypothetical protein